MLNFEVNGRLAAGTIVVAAVAFPVYWYQQGGPTPWDNKAIAVLALYIIASSGLVAHALGKLGPELTSAVTDRKFQESMSALASKCVPLLFVTIILWSCYWLWSIQNAT
jgi:hypothetical protein